LTRTLPRGLVSGGNAVVNLSWGADTIAPTQPGNVNATSTGTNTSRVTWTASTDNRAVAGYRVSRDGVVLGTTTSLQWNDSGLTPGTTVLYSVIAYDAVPNYSTAGTKSWLVPTPDTTAPTAPGSFRTTSLTKAKVTFAWSASSDAGGVAGYRIYRNNVLVATTTSLTWTDTRQRTQSTYYAVAYDAAGNVSAHSASVTVAAK